MTNDTTCDGVLKSLRRIIRAIDVHSRNLVHLHGLTGPQLIVLRELGSLGEKSVSQIAQDVSLSQATVTGILDRLEKRGYVLRQRSGEDRRRTLVKATPLAGQTLAKSPPLLQEHFVRRFSQLRDWEQTQILAALQRIVDLMEARDLDAAPLLETGLLTPTSEEPPAAVPSAGSPSGGEPGHGPGNSDHDSTGRAGAAVRT